VRRFRHCLIALALALGQATAIAQADVAPREPTEAARGHFRTGVKLYQDGNYAGALAEFEAAYAAKPSAAALQNIALAQKALFRYAQAAATLRSLLAGHAKELATDERTAVESAIEELSALGGGVRLQVVPADARLTIDGRDIDGASRTDVVPLDVGEHTIVAEAPGHARLVRTIRVAAGQTVRANLSLQRTSGVLSVVSNDPAAAIAIDGKPVGYGRWSGAVPPGRHLVQVYKRGAPPFARTVEVALGETQHVVASLASAGTGGSSDGAQATPADVHPAGARGWYGLLTLSSAAVSEVPSGLDSDQAKANGGALGLRGGYRLLDWLSLELMLEGGAAKGSLCRADPNALGFDCGSDRPAPADYTLGSLRIGPNARFMTTGRVLRFISSLGFGVVRHTFTTGNDRLNEQLDDAAGTDGYFLLELGGQLNLGHVLIELALGGTLETLTDLNANAPRLLPSQPLYDADSASFVGISLRGGWSAWSP
jgi:hypothetical protein